MLIPSFAFLGWTMRQPITAFDGLAPDFDADWRWTTGLALALILGIAAGLLGTKADRQPAPTQRTPPGG